MAKTTETVSKKTSPKNYRESLSTGKKGRGSHSPRKEKTPEQLARSARKAAKDSDFGL